MSEQTGATGVGDGARRTGLMVALIVLLGVIAVLLVLMVAVR